MNAYEWCLMAWKNGWATADKLQIWVDKGKITQEEYEKITQGVKADAG